MSLRRFVGFLGFLFPVVLLALNGFAFEDSISDYYHRTGARDVFVGILFAIGLFLLSYKGYDKSDDLWGSVAGVCAVGVALFPNESSVGVLHLVCAAALFLVLAYFSLFLFTKSGEVMTDEKRTRNKVYRSCGLTMLVCMLLIVVCVNFLKDLRILGVHPVFLLESAMLFAFGLSWLTKGETLWRDAH